MEAMCYIVYMQQVGMRELRHRLREYLVRVDAGERFEVTVFGRAIAELGPPSRHATTLDRLVQEGRVSLPAVETGDLPAPRPARAGMTATEALLAERKADPR
jgi:antitoxin (DNA-binding transcriptional repressor) of toxin-antitoxin stability system